MYTAHLVRRRLPLGADAREVVATWRAILCEARGLSVCACVWGGLCVGARGLGRLHARLHARQHAWPTAAASSSQRGKQLRLAAAVKPVVTTMPSSQVKQRGCPLEHKAAGPAAHLAGAVEADCRRRHKHARPRALRRRRDGGRDAAGDREAAGLDSCLDLRRPAGVGVRGVTGSSALHSRGLASRKAPL